MKEKFIKCYILYWNYDKYLLDLEILKRVDSHGMYTIYDKWADIAIEHYEQEFEPINFDNLTHIVFAGMGGSGAIGDIFSSILSKTNIHVNVVKGYLLPKTVNSDSLIVTTSVSGNTQETLSVLKAAKKMDAKVISFSNGGLIEKFSEKSL